MRGLSDGLSESDIQLGLKLRMLFHVVNRQDADLPALLVDIKRGPH